MIQNELRKVLIQRSLLLPGKGEPTCPRQKLEEIDLGFVSCYAGCDNQVPDPHHLRVRPGQALTHLHAQIKWSDNRKKHGTWRPPRFLLFGVLIEQDWKQMGMVESTKPFAGNKTFSTLVQALCTESRWKVVQVYTNCKSLNQPTYIHKTTKNNWLPGMTNKRPKYIGDRQPCPW